MQNFIKNQINPPNNKMQRLTEDICNLSTLCINYRKLSPSTEMPPFPGLNLNLSSEIVDNQDDIGGILNLLKMWQSDGQLKDNRVQQFMRNILQINVSINNNIFKIKIGGLAGVLFLKDLKQIL